VRVVEAAVTWCRRCKGKCRSELPPGRWCPTCGKLLAVGAWCPKHGDPLLLSDTFHKPARPRKPRQAPPSPEAEWERRRVEWKAEAERIRAEAERVWARYGRTPAPWASGAGAYVPAWALTLGFTAIPTDAVAVKSAFRRLAFKHHPDRGGEAAEFIKIKTAYDLGIASLGGRA